MGERPLCLEYRSPLGHVIYPVLLRDLSACEFAGPPARRLYDVVTPPYGYSGPFAVCGTLTAELLQRFFAVYADWARATGAVVEYCTFNPKPESGASHRFYPGKAEARTETVIRSLDLDRDGLWSDYRGAVRRNIRAAAKKGITVEQDFDGVFIGEFLEIYQETMDRNSALTGYRLNREFLERFGESLRGYYVYFHARQNGRIITSELVLISGDSTFFFRGGTRTGALQTRANVLLKHEVIFWSKAQGKRHYLLGAGMEPGDSLYRFKLSLAPRGSRPLWVGKWTVRPEVYTELVEARKAFESGRGTQWEPTPDYYAGAAERNCSEFVRELKSLIRLEQ